MKMEMDILQTFKTDSAQLDKITDFAAQRILTRVNQKTMQTKRMIQGVIKEKQSSGRTYISRRSTPGNIIYHVASRPGFPPNEDTGHLRQGVSSRLNRQNKSITISVKPKNEPYDYAPALEYGTKKMAPRPFFLSTIKKHIKSADYQKAIKQVMYSIANELKGKLLERKL